MSGRRRVRACAAVIACVVGAGQVLAGGLELAHADQARAAADAPAHRVPAARTAPTSHAAPTSHTAPASPTRSPGSPRAPNRPPLGTGTGTGTGIGKASGEEASASAPISGGDPLASNGLDSPLCRDARGELASAEARDCRDSGFEGAQAPTGNYAFDVHINTGVTHWGNDISVMVVDLAQYVWTALVAVVRGVIVILDWCFTIDLLKSSAMSGVEQGLRETQATFTRPWLVVVLAIAAVGALYHGLIRRRVAETLGEALLMMAMIAAGMWVIVNPTGTVGALDAWANEASLAALAAAGGESPDHPDRTLAQSNQNLFSAAIDAPWCFMEFGNVGWCNAPAGRPLKEAAGKIAALASATGKENDSSREALESETELSGKGLSRQSAALLRGASSNGELFLALPANGEERNSINDKGSLFHALCGSGSEPCQGSTAGEAEFRTQSGVWSRVIGLAMIAFGLLGMLLLLGFIGWQLLHAAIACLIYLLLTPAAVLLPALGEGGRSGFRMWVMRLLGAVTSKLIYSFLLGAVLMVEHVLATIDMFGWFTRWLVMSSLWWIVFVRRHRLFDLAHTATGRGEHRSVTRRVSDALESRKGVAAARWAKRKLSQPGPSVERRHRLAQAGRERAQQIAGMQVSGGLEHRYREASELVAEGDAAQARISAKRTRLGRMQAQMSTWMNKSAQAGSARTAALEELGKRRRLSEREAELHKEKDPLAGLDGEERDKRAAAIEKRRAARERRMDYLRRTAAKRGAEMRSHHRRAGALQPRMDGLRAEIDRDQATLTGAKQMVEDGKRAKGATGVPYTRAQAGEYERYLDDQAKLPRGQRDHAGAAGVAGLTRGEFEQLGPQDRLKAQVKIDRELTKRVVLGDAASDMTARAGAGSVGRRDKRKGSDELDGKLGGLIAAQARHQPSGSGSGRIVAGASAVAARNAHVRTRRGSPVLDDGHEVAARRKRQLGSDRP